MHAGPGSAQYDVSLEQLFSHEDAVVRVRHVLAEKIAWVTQRDLDDLCRAIRDLKGFDLPQVPLATEPAYGHFAALRAIGDML